VLIQRACGTGKITVNGHAIGRTGQSRSCGRSPLATGRLIPHECAERARLAGALIEPGRLDRTGPGEAVLLWCDDHSEAWLNLCGGRTTPATTTTLARVSAST